MTTTREKALEAALRACLAQFEPNQADYTDGDQINRPGWLEATYAALALPPDAPTSAPSAEGEHESIPGVLRVSWTVLEEDDGRAYKIYDSTGSMVAMATAPDTPAKIRWDDITARAHLIAAAPDMLAALQAVLEANGAEQEDARNLASDAIARATGKEG